MIALIHSLMPTVAYICIVLAFVCWLVGEVMDSARFTNVALILSLVLVLTIPIHIWTQP